MPRKVEAPVTTGRWDDTTSTWDTTTDTWDTI
jgi:hypothetical protein